MGTAYLNFNPENAIPLPTGVAPIPALIFTGTNLTVASYSFDAATDEGVQFVVPNLIDYTASSNITMKVAWYGATAVTGNVVWGGSIAAITPNTDTQNIETDSWATEALTTGAHLGTTAQRPHTHDVIINSLDSVASGDYVSFRLMRRASNGGDTMAGDARMVGVTISYPTIN